MMGRCMQGLEPDIPGLPGKSPTNQVLTRHFKDVGPLEPWTGVIDRILVDEHEVVKKQRHTANPIYERLWNENEFMGQNIIAKDYVRERGSQTKEMLVLCRAVCSRLASPFVPSLSGRKTSPASWKLTWWPTAGRALKVSISTPSARWTIATGWVDWWGVLGKG